MRTTPLPKRSKWEKQRGGKKPEQCKLKADELDITERIPDDVIVSGCISLCQKRGTCNEVIDSSFEVPFLTRGLEYQWRTVSSVSYVFVTRFVSLVNGLEVGYDTTEFLSPESLSVILTHSIYSL